ncbi:probable cytochrome P450 49a1 [Anoplophora glabripennis]|uniref:probable cytochrome P450 49a1 n=1 Tax=Anoplophora glabripennis TaxID=217634 RepID=UPI000873AB3D|nr:probable cytochrome P450 49a1 [Anoplophora glabripennis]XP_018570998.1 probable cytochrome P450 49a1 [Anoplophora glabripennis]
MSKEIPRKLLRPRAVQMMKKRWITDKPTAVDRTYSTAIAVTPEMYDENVFERKIEPVECIPKEYSEIPGPKEWPLIGNAWRFAPIIGQYKIHELDKVMWSLRREYGKIVKVGGLVGHPDLLFVFDGDLIHKVFRREEGMPHRPSMPSLHYYKQVFQKDFFEGNEGVIGVHGPKWDAFRKEVQQILLPPATARKYVEPLNVIATDFLVRMENMLDENNELPNYFLSEIYKWALESVARVSLNTRLGCLEPNLPKHSESQRIIDSINTFFWNVAEVELKMPVWRVYKNKSFRKYIGALEDFRTLCLKYINQCMEQMKEKNYDNVREEEISIVEMILKKTGNPKLAAVLALDLLLVGVDTTSIAAASTIYQLSQNADKQQKLFEELQKALPNPDSKVDVVAQNSIPYLKACIKETLRMYPVIIGNGRSLQSDAILAGYKVPKGTHVIFPHLVVSNSEDYITEPEKFVPERWLKNTEHGKCPAHQKKIHPYISLPFGYGRRSCLGRRFAETELNILLAKIFRKYKVDYNYGPLSYKITPTYVPVQPLKFQLTLRE